MSKGEDYFQVDDFFITHKLAQKSTKQIEFLDWSNNFLKDYPKEKSDIIHKKLFTPQIMVGTDLDKEEIKKISKKFKKCHEKNCFAKIYENNELLDYIKPDISILNQNKQNKEHNEL